jgi:hypothetical protein
MYTKLGVIGTDQASIDFINQLSTTNTYELHLAGDQKLLNTFSHIQNIRMHRTVKQVSQHVDTIIYFTPSKLDEEVTDTHLKIININGLGIKEINTLHLMPSSILFSIDIGMRVKHSHSLLCKGSHIPNNMCDLAEKIMRECGSIQWTNNTHELHILSGIGAILPLLNLILLESVNMYLDEQSISAQDSQTFTQNLSLGMTKFIQTHSDSAELLNQSCEYLHAKDLYLKVGAMLKNSQLDKILSNCLTTALKEQQVDQLESGSDTL